MPKATHTGNTSERTFIQLLQKLDHSRSTKEKFRDLIELAYCSFAKVTASTPEHAQHLEERYMRIVNRYNDKDTIRAYPELIGIAINAVSNNYADFLGPVATELEVLDHRQGQFFTPYPVALLMAKMTLTDTIDTITAKGYITVQEPAAGAGGMVLALAEAMEEQHYILSEHMIVNAIDLNELAYQMCFLQLAWRGVPALVQHGNSLSAEIYDGAWTSAAGLFYEKHGHLFPPPDKSATPSPKQTPKPPPSRLVQPSLF